MNFDTLYVIYNMLPNELIIEIYNYTVSKYQMVEVFPWLKNIIPKCCCCGNESFFVVKFKCDDSCFNCKNHNTISDDVYICNLNCKNLYYDIEYGNYIVKPSYSNNYKIQAELLCEKNDCFYCGRRVMYDVKADGYQIRKLPTQPKSKIQENVELFIASKLVLDKISEIKMSNMIYLYKEFFNVTKEQNNKQDNKQIQDEFRKVFKTRKQFYTGCYLKL